MFTVCLCYIFTKSVILVLRPSTSADAIDRAINHSDCNRSIRIECEVRAQSSFLQWHLAMKTSISYYLFYLVFISSRSGCSGFTSIEIDRSVAIIAQYALTTKSDLKLFSPVKSSDEDIFIFRGYYCRYQLAERPVRRGIICEKSSKCASQMLKAVSKRKYKHAKHFG